MTNVYHTNIYPHSMSLTDWGQGKIAADDIFKVIFLNENVGIVGSNWQKVSIGSDDGLAQNKLLSELMMSWLTDAYMRHSVSLC